MAEGSGQGRVVGLGAAIVCQGPFLLLTQREQQLTRPHLPNPGLASGPRTRGQLMASVEWPASHSGYLRGGNTESRHPTGEAGSVTTNR